MDTSALPVRRVRFAFDADTETHWTPDRPEFACVANGVSLLMPHLEPLVAKAVRGADVVPSGPPTLEFARQEMQHLRQHQNFNELLHEEHPGLRRLDRLMGKVFKTLGRRSRGFRLGFAVGSETVAFHTARYTERRRRELFANADPLTSTLFLWHLAEEIEHKTVAHDAAVVSKVSQRSMITGKLAALVVMGIFVMLNSFALLWARRRIFRPICHVRMAIWSVGFAFELLPHFAASLLPSHDPRHLVDPTWYLMWLDEFDEESGTLPLWNSSLADSGMSAETVKVA